MQSLKGFPCSISKALNKATLWGGILLILSTFSPECRWESGPYVKLNLIREGSLFTGGGAVQILKLCTLRICSPSTTAHYDFAPPPRKPCTDIWLPFVVYHWGDQFFFQWAKRGGGRIFWGSKRGGQNIFHKVKGGSEFFPRRQRGPEFF